MFRPFLETFWLTGIPVSISGIIRFLKKIRNFSQSIDNLVISLKLIQALLIFYYYLYYYYYYYYYYYCCYLLLLLLLLLFYKNRKRLVQVTFNKKYTDRLFTPSQEKLIIVKNALINQI